MSNAVLGPAIADSVIPEAVATGNACIVKQVIQACLNIVLRKADVPLDVSAARAGLAHVLMPLLWISASVHRYCPGLDIQDRYQFGVYESLIIAAAVTAMNLLAKT